MDRNVNSQQQRGNGGKADDDPLAVSLEDKKCKNEEDYIINIVQ
jgi:hypothetical protein